MVDGYLWTMLDISGLSESQAKRFVERSKSRHLRFYWRFVDEDTPRFLWQTSMLTRNLVRTEELVCTVHPSPQQFLNEAAPALQKLELSMLRSISGEVIVSPRLFDETTPKLRDVSLYDCRVSWNAGCLKNLTHLKITLDSFTRLASENVDLLSALSNSPFLETLRLIQCSSRCNPDTDFVPFVGREKIRLIRLRDIKLTFPPAYIFHILGSVILPESLQNMYLEILRPSNWVESARDHFAFADLLQPRYLPTALLDKIDSCEISSGFRGILLFKALDNILRKSMPKSKCFQTLNNISGGSTQENKCKWVIVPRVNISHHCSADCPPFCHESTPVKNDILARTACLNITVYKEDSKKTNTRIADLATLLSGARTATSLSITWLAHGFLDFLRAMPTMMEPPFSPDLRELTIYNNTQWTLDGLVKLFVLCKYLRRTGRSVSLRVEGPGQIHVKNDIHGVAVLRQLDRLGLRCYTTVESRCYTEHWSIWLCKDCVHIDESWPYDIISMFFNHLSSALQLAH